MSPISLVVKRTRKLLAGNPQSSLTWRGLETGSTEHRACPRPYHERPPASSVINIEDGRTQALLQNLTYTIALISPAHNQVSHNLESQRLQYAMRDRLERFGWTADLVRSRALLPSSRFSWGAGRPSTPFSRRRCTICSDSSRTIGAGEINSERRD